LTFYFDRCFGKRFPEALRTARPPFTVEFHHDPNNKFHFNQKTPDDEWLAKVGAEGWIVFSHDRKFHRIEAESTAIKQHKVGCFYLWGANNETWDKLCCFMGGYDGIAQRIALLPKPFIFNVERSCRIRHVKIP
jgi:hypothetical protein